MEDAVLCVLRQPGRADVGVAPLAEPSVGLLGFLKERKQSGQKPHFDMLASRATRSRPPSNHFDALRKKCQLCWSMSAGWEEARGMIEEFSVMVGCFCPCA